MASSAEVNSEAVDIENFNNTRKDTNTNRTSAETQKGSTSENVRLSEVTCGTEEENITVSSAGKKSLVVDYSDSDSDSNSEP